VLIRLRQIYPFRSRLLADTGREQTNMQGYELTRSDCVKAYKQANMKLNETVIDLLLQRNRAKLARFRTDPVCVRGGTEPGHGPRAVNPLW
jgi:hypothetical protein